MKLEWKSDWLFGRTCRTDFLKLTEPVLPGLIIQLYENAVRLMNSSDARAFDLSQEPVELREAYGRTVFGQGCLLARRLIEQGVSFVEVSLGTTSGGVGWDTHTDNFTAVRTLSTELDAGWSTLMKDLADRGLLDSTTILWMGEFGRTPRINANVGRDHYPLHGRRFSPEQVWAVVRPTEKRTKAEWLWLKGR